jgi:hypothetical protein
VGNSRILRGFRLTIAPPTIPDVGGLIDTPQ